MLKGKLHMLLTSFSLDEGGNSPKIDCEKATIDDIIKALHEVAHKGIQVPLYKDSEHLHKTFG